MQDYLNKSIDYPKQTSGLAKLGQISLERGTYQTEYSKTDIGLLSTMSYDEFKHFISEVYSKLLQDGAYVTSLELAYYTFVYPSGGFYYPKGSKGWCLYYDGVSNLYEQDISLLNEDSTLVLNSFNILDKDYIIEKSLSHLSMSFLKELISQDCDYHLALLSYCYCLDTSYRYNKPVVSIENSRLYSCKSEERGLSNYINFDYIIKFAILDSESDKFKNNGVDSTLLDYIFYNTKTYIRFDMGYLLKFNVYFLDDIMYAVYLNDDSAIHIAKYNKTDEVIYLPYFVGIWIGLNKEVNNVDISSYDENMLFTGLSVSLNSRYKRK